jgi:hypothetical protein
MPNIGPKSSNSHTFLKTCAFSGEKFEYEYFEDQCKRNELYKQEYAKKPVVCPCEVGPVRSRRGRTDPLIEGKFK